MDGPEIDHCKKIPAKKMLSCFRGPNYPKIHGIEKEKKTQNDCTTTGSFVSITSNRNDSPF